MSKSSKNILINSIIVLVLCFLIIISYLVYSDYNYYSAYTKEELSKFFSMKRTLLYDVRQALFLTILQSVVYVPMVTILEKTKMNRFLKIIIVLIIVFIASFILLLLNL